MTNNKQSSVKWLYEKMFVHRGNITIEEFEQAKAMHKEEHGKTWDDSLDRLDARGGVSSRAWVDFDDYYKERFQK